MKKNLIYKKPTAKLFFALLAMLLVFPCVFCEEFKTIANAYEPVYRTCSSPGTYSNPYEPSPTMATAVTMPINATSEQWHTFYSSGDIDYVKFDATAGKRYQIYVSAGGSFSTIVDSLGTVLASPARELLSPYYFEGTIYWTCSSSGTYYVKSEKGSYSYEKYALGVLETSPDSLEPNESFPEAKEIPADTGEYFLSLYSLVEPDIDYCKFDAQAGKTYNIRIEGKAFLTDFSANLYDAPKDSPLKAIQRGGGGMAGPFGCSDPAEFTLNCSETGTYYLEIESVGFVNYGIYTLKITSNSPPAGPPRISGTNRYQTATEVSKENWTNSNCVVIATGEDFPDTLAGASLAKAYDSPLLLVTKDLLPSETIAEINRLGATEAIVLGGEGAISSSVCSQIQSQTLVNVIIRIGGENRHDTAKEIALKLKEKLGTQMSNTAVIATGENFPDALAVSGFAGYKNMPILLVGKDAISDETLSAISSLGITSSIVVGGTGVISDAVKSNLPSSTRLSGENRYQTAKEIAEYAASYGMSWQTTYIATGTNFPDALSCGAVCAKKGCIMLLTSPTSLGESPDTRTILSNNKANIAEIRLIGGSGAISDDVGSQISATVN